MIQIVHKLHSNSDQIQLKKLLNVSPTTFYYLIRFLIIKYLIGDIKILKKGTFNM